MRPVASDFNHPIRHTWVGGRISIVPTKKQSIKQRVSIHDTAATLRRLSDKTRRFTESDTEITKKSPPAFSVEQWQNVQLLLLI